MAEARVQEGQVAVGSNFSGFSKWPVAIQEGVRQASYRPGQGRTSQIGSVEEVLGWSVDFCSTEGCVGDSGGGNSSGCS